MLDYQGHPPYVTYLSLPLQMSATTDASVTMILTKGSRATVLARDAAIRRRREALWAPGNWLSGSTNLGLLLDSVRKRASPPWGALFFAL